MSYEVWGEPEERDWYTEEEMAEVRKENDALVADLASMIRRMSYALKRSGINDKLVRQSVELLKKHDLGGSILRAEYTEGPKT